MKQAKENEDTQTKEDKEHIDHREDIKNKGDLYYIKDVEDKNYMEVFNDIEDIENMVKGTPPCPNSPVEFEILPEKITTKQINSLSYTEFPKEHENDPCQVVSFGEKSYRQFLNFYLFLFLKGTNRPTGKNYDKANK